MNFNDKGIIVVKEQLSREGLKDFKEFAGNNINNLYISRILKLINNNEYFNAGMIMFNTSKINKQWYKSLRNDIPWETLLYLDQDFLNLIYENDLLFISEIWNWKRGRKFGYNYFDIRFWVNGWRKYRKAYILHAVGKYNQWDKKLIWKKMKRIYIKNLNSLN